MTVPDTAPLAPRRASLERRTTETRVTCSLDLDGDGRCEARSGLGFLDHMLAQLARHARFDLQLACEGDTWVDDHHTLEDCALVLGACLERTLGERRGLRRFGSALVPLDEALARVAVDLSGRPTATVDLGLVRERLGDVATENLTHFLRSLASAARLTLHVDVLRGENDHHRVEAAFKALALALRAAVEQDPRLADAVPSTKGVLA